MKVERGREEVVRWTACAIASGVAAIFIFPGAHERCKEGCITRVSRQSDEQGGGIITAEEARERSPWKRDRVTGYTYIYVTGEPQRGAIFSAALRRKLSSAAEGW